MWWKHAPHSFHVVREPEGKLAGFFCLLDSESVTPEMEEGIPNSCYAVLTVLPPLADP
jgi:hypothetical protein